MRLADLVGESAVLGQLGEGKIQPTPLYEAVAERVRALEASLVIIDALADAYGGDENNRGQVRQFINLLKRLGRDYDCAALALAHPSLSGMNSGSGLSGSTHWNNGPRSRLYFEVAKSAEDNDVGTNMRTLTVQKANYAPRGGAMKVRWQDGVYVAEGGPSLMDSVARSAQADTTFIALLEAYEADERYVSANPGSTVAPTVFAKDLRAKGLGKKALTDAMNRLFQAKRIRTGHHGRPSDPRSHIELVKPGTQE